ncbi:hypothetical protein [Kribbella sp. NPDC051718]|uniref:hypothetical protein n=1 Tax=Kribbella sp. NPDC051718 TaxID=3155168 RepID=UPI003419FE19
MNSQHTRTRRGSARALVAVLLLAGVFAMHGLTGNHDAAMVMTHMPAAALGHEPAPAAAHAPAPILGEPAPPDAAHSMSTTKSPAVAPPIPPTPAPPHKALTVEPGKDGHVHAMGDACLAMLAALLLALIVSLAQRSLTVAHPIQLAGATLPVAADGPSPPWRQPTLSKLCVLRT